MKHKGIALKTMQVRLCNPEDRMRRANMCLIGVLCRGIMAKHFLEFINLMTLQIQEAEGISSRINTRTSACIKYSSKYS